MSNRRYDIVYPSEGMPYMEPHFCREFTMNGNGDFEGCNGTDPNHGFSFEEAKQELIAFWELSLEEIKAMQEADHQEQDDRQWWEDNVS